MSNHSRKIATKRRGARSSIKKKRGKDSNMSHHEKRGEPLTFQYIEKGFLKRNKQGLFIKTGDSKW